MSKITKLGLGIVAFDGNEHLKNITYELRNECDHIVVCLQKFSYHGEPLDESDIEEVYELKNHGFIDDIIWFEPIVTYKDKSEDVKPRYIEADKRNFILNNLERKGCSHALVIDSDEFYDREEFHNAKQLINDNNDYRISYCQYVNYYRDYKHLLLNGGELYVPFITDIKYRFNFDNGNFPRPTDPTRRYYLSPHDDCKSFSVLSYDVIKMHHFSWIRKDIVKKMDSWSSKKYFDESVRERVLERYNNYKEGQCAIITILCPNNELIVYTLDKEYVHPHYKLDDKIDTDFK